MKVLMCALVSLTMAACAGQSSRPSAKEREVASQNVIYMNPDTFRAINLEGLSIFNVKDPANNILPYNVTAIEASPEILQALLKETDDDVVLSRVYRAQSATFKDIYVYVGQNISNPGTGFKLNTVFVNNAGHVRSTRMTIESASLRELNLSHGPSDAKEFLIARPKENQTFFPY
ncbi:MAG: hypothetical protein J7501_04580 [Bdellovibrio sp.]|nr:hypothetical protein [Bdellovibrio sp.]